MSNELPKRILPIWPQSDNSNQSTTPGKMKPQLEEFSHWLKNVPNTSIAPLNCTTSRWWPQNRQLACLRNQTHSIQNHHHQHRCQMQILPNAAHSYSQAKFLPFTVTPAPKLYVSWLSLCIVSRWWYWLWLVFVLESPVSQSPVATTLHRTTNAWRIQMNLGVNNTCGSSSFPGTNGSVGKTCLTAVFIAYTHLSRDNCRGFGDSLHIDRTGVTFGKRTV